MHTLRLIGIGLLFAGWVAFVFWLWMKLAELFGAGKGFPRPLKIQKLFDNDKKAR